MKKYYVLGITFALGIIIGGVGSQAISHHARNERQGRHHTMKKHHKDYRMAKKGRGEMRKIIAHLPENIQQEAREIVKASRAELKGLKKETRQERGVQQSKENRIVEKLDHMQQKAKIKAETLLKIKALTEQKA